MVRLEGMVSQGFFSITTSGFLAAFALALGANNLQIGILAAIPFITQPLQIPIILLVERFKRRKLIAVPSFFFAQLLWFPMALIPVYIKVPGGLAISLLIGLLAIRGILVAISNCSWNSWLRDLIPQNILGHVFSRRLTLSTIVAVVFSIIAAFFVDYWRTIIPGEDAILGYTFVIIFGAVFLGLAAPIFMSAVPEPQMKSTEEPSPSLWKIVISPFKDSNFRKLVVFLISWGFALNLAVPFFAVYMLKRLGMPLSTVIMLSVLSQLFNILFLRVWGPLADRFGSKVILSLCASLYLLVILGWTFTTMPEQYVLTTPLLVVLHIFAGIATAGVTLTVGTIGLKLAPQGNATSYLAGTSLATSIGAGLGPLVGGLFADFFSVREFTISFSWVDPTQILQLPAVYLTGFDFLFAIAFIVGVGTLRTLGAIIEEGEVSREIVLDELLAQTRVATRAVSSVPGLRYLANFPFSYLRRVPGIDVAVGVTAYQLTDMAKTATQAAIQGWKTTGRIARTLELGLSKVWKPEKATGENGIAVARHTVRGVVHAIDESSFDMNKIVSPAMVGIVRSLKRSKVVPGDAFQGAGYGIIQGAAETGLDLTNAAIQAIKGAQNAAGQLGLDESLAEVKTAKGVIEAIKDINPDSATKIKKSLRAKFKEIKFS
jgi:MFS family permease